MNDILIVIRIVLPVILVGIIAIFTIHIAKKISECHKTKEKQEDENYMAVGMAVGMGIGTSLGIALEVDNLAIGTSIGMLLGMIVGMNYKK
ncbi:MAG: DUF2700 domain-containing protein [Clostridiales bacterium]|nr:DUF2700 domain-containing protein [Clostridiales bacterium]MDD7347381.1 DUF2700 domain-containing protein [Clostridiales bacterium]MDY4060723.1 hypothetical protein [Anaerovoracaceae bacterium]